MLKEFKDFAMRGNVVDMAVGIVIGGAFGTIVKSLVDDVLMPPIGLLLGGVDFSDLCSSDFSTTISRIFRPLEVGFSDPLKSIFPTTISRFFRLR